MTRRHEYALDLSALDRRGVPVTVPHLELRAAQPTDSDALAELMLEAYRGTIDYDGETLEDAIDEVHAYLAGEGGGEPLMDASRLAYAGPTLAGACLASFWPEWGQPLIAYVVTRADWKNLGVGRQLLWSVLQAPREQGHREIRAFITEGNTPSERLFRRMGFRRVRNPFSNANT